ncbi:MAG TPA: inositol monophosphatase family protein [Chitinispirillaceae bacterium]|nr:inositol monophosphatase family protein [Chitinispirillaceae bacterium]
MKEFVSVAVEAAREAGALLFDNFGKAVEMEHKADKSIVTVLDKQCQKIIIDKLHSSFFSHQFIAEENGMHLEKVPMEYTWVIDPLDGTHNYIRGIPFYGVSIGLLRGNEFLAGVIYLPHEDALYVSEKGCGAFKNDQRLHISKVTEIMDCTLAFDSGFRNSVEVKISTLKKIAPRFFNTRIFGASVRNLTYLAEGIVDAVIEFDDNMWDFAAGISLVMEAGGVVSDHSGSAFIPESRNYLASNRNVHFQILELLNT